MNGSHLPSTGRPRTPTTPSAAPTPEDPIERRIGELTADTVLMLRLAVRIGADGAMAAPTRDEAVNCSLKLYQIQQSMMTDDFPG